MKRLPICALATALLLGSVSAFGQDASTRPIRMIIPFPPGGSIDRVARLIVQDWVTQLQQQIVVDNRGGAGGTIGTELVANANPDGHTILYGNLGPLSIGPSVYKKLGYDLFGDLAPVSLAASAPFILLSSTKLPVKTVQEFIAYAKARPGQLNYASSGVGSGLQLSAELFKSVTGLDIVHVPYKGIGQAIPDIAGGRIHMLVYTYVGAIPHLKAGRLRALMSGGERRSAQLPDVPTCFEVGLPGFHSTAWHGIVAPAGTPKKAILRLQSTLAATMRKPQLREVLAREDVELVGNSPEAFAKFMREEHQKWAKVVRAIGLKVN
jgi:tripartite-type tricarboxylate transporter receptor subunit TctC